MEKGGIPRKGDKGKMVDSKNLEVEEEKTLRREAWEIYLKDRGKIWLDIVEKVKEKEQETGIDLMEWMEKDVLTAIEEYIQKLVMLIVLLEKGEKVMR